MSFQVPQNPVVTSASFIGYHANQCMNHAKESPKTPELFKTYISTVQDKQLCARLRPWFEKCDSKLEGVFENINDKIGHVADTLEPYVHVGQESFVENDGDLQKVAVAVCTQFADNPPVWVDKVVEIIEPIKDYVMSTPKEEEEGGVQNVPPGGVSLRGAKDNFGKCEEAGLVDPPKGDDDAQADEYDEWYILGQPTK